MKRNNGIPNKKLFIFSVLFMLAALKCSVAQQPSQCLAIITEIHGEAFVKKSDKSEFAKAGWGTQLFKGDKIKTTDRSEVKILFSNSSMISLGANSLISISGKESPGTEISGKVKRISSATMIDLSALILKNKGNEERAALAGLRSGDSEQSVILTSPCNSLIKKTRPDFSWIPKKSFDKYIVNLYSHNGLVWSRRISDSPMKYPEDEKELMCGESYFWNVECEDLIENKKSDNQNFSVLSSDKLIKAEEQERLIRSTFKDEPEGSSLHSVLGAFYIDQGLLQDAIIEFQAISDLNPDAPIPHEILGSLYSETGNKDKAIEELQKALALEKK